MQGWRVDLCSFFFPPLLFNLHIIYCISLCWHPRAQEEILILIGRVGWYVWRSHPPLHWAGKTLELRLDSETRFTWGSGSQEYWFDLKRPKVFVKSHRLAQRGSGSGWGSLDWLITQQTLKSCATMPFLSTFKNIFSDATDQNMITNKPQVRFCGWYMVD